VTGRDHLRALVAAAPANALLTVPAQWLREALGDAQEAPTPPEASDLTLQAFGLRFGRSASTVRLWCEERRIPGAWKLNGKAWRIPASSVELFRRQQGAPASNPVRPSGGDLSDWRRRPA